MTRMHINQIKEGTQITELITENKAISQRQRSTRESRYRSHKQAPTTNVTDLDFIQFVFTPSIAGYNFACACCNWHTIRTSTFGYRLPWSQTGSKSQHSLHFYCKLPCEGHLKLKQDSKNLHLNSVTNQRLSVV